MYNVFDINGNVKCKISAFEYRGEFMSVSSIVATIKSSTPIDFANGDYISFRGEKYTLRYTPAYKKQARKDTYSEAFVYDSMVFYAASDELTRCDFLDVVKADNNIHYTSLPNFTFYAESVQELADRIKANLDRLYKGANAWTVKVADGTVSKPHNFTCSNIKCWDALVLANTELNLNFIIKGRTITIGSVGSAIEHEFSYGKGNGLKDLSSSTSESAAIVTRLRAYGSTRNLPYRYYNKLYINAYGNVKYFKDTPSGGYSPLLSESMYMPNLMLPMLRKGSLIGNTGDLYNEDGILCGKYRLGGTIGKDAYIESVTGIEKYGINEGTVFFDTDTEDGEDNIYPSMEGMTAQQLIDAGFNIQLDAGDNGNLDEIYSAEAMTDDGYLPDNGSDINPSSFKITLKDIGFNISDYLLPGESAQIYFASGELVGRTFEIASITKSGKKQILQVNRLLDSDIEWVFPNKHYNAKAGDKFKLINIYMPDEYVVAAEFRLLDRAKLYLAENDHNTINYAPTIDDIFLARNPQIAESIREGDIFTFSDDDLGLYKSITISTISIKIGESLIPKYSITLSENKDATLVDRIASQVSDSLGKTYLSSDNIVSLSKLQFDKRYLRKDVEDIATKKLTLAGGAVADHLQSSTYTSGFGGKGYEIKYENGESYLTVDNEMVRGNAQVGGNASVGGQLTADNITSSDYNAEFSGFTLKNTDGGSYLEVAKLNVLKKAVFRALDIKKIDHIGGANVTSPASCKIASVATDASAYKCYFNATDGDKTIHNEWKVGDQALCHAFNLTTPRYYWRLVTAVSAEPTEGYHWVALSMTDCDTDSDAPIAEDDIVCFGNRTDTDRQSAIILDSEGPSAPYLRQFKGINNYNPTDANIVTQLSPERNIIRGEQIELITSSGNKGLMDIANETLSSAKGYTDTASSSALASAKTYADGVGTNATSTAKSYADGLFADAESYIQEREAYLQTQITANDEEIALRATKVEVQTVSDNVGALATRVTGAEASIKTNADNIALKAAKTEVDTIKTDLGNVTSRVSTAEAAIQVNADNISQRVTKTEYDSGITNANLLATAISKGVMLYNDPTFKTGMNGIMRYNGDYSTVKREQDSTAPNDSGYVLTISKNPNTTTGSRLGFCWGVKTRANRVLICRIVAKIPVGFRLLWAWNPYGSGGSQKWLTSIDGTGDWCEYVHYLKCGSTGTFNTTEYFYLDNHKDDTTFQLAYATVIDATSAEQYSTVTQYKALSSELSVQSNRISSVVSEQESMIKEWGFSDFVQQELTWATTSQGSILGKMNAQAENYHYLKLTNVKAGDVVRFELNDKLSGALVYSLFGCDGDGQGAWEASGHSTAADEWLGFILFEISHDGEVVSESVINVDCPELYVYLSDDFANKSNIKVYLIRAKMTAQSRIDQSADNIRLQVGQAGINLDSKVITLDASKTIVTGDLAVRTVKTYWDAAQTQLKSAYNGNGEGTIVYYYPNGRVMKEDTFVTDSNGNVLGMRTTYYKADGSVAWTINEGGFMTTLPDYWTVLNNGNDMCYTTNEATMMDMLKQYLTDAMRFFSSAKFSRFVSQSGNYKNYNGKVSKAVRSSETPTTSMLWAGILIYSVELYKDGARPTYIVTYEVCTTALGQVGAILTKKFNSLGEVK